MESIPYNNVLSQNIPFDPVDNNVGRNQRGGASVVHRASILIFILSAAAVAGGARIASAMHRGAGGSVSLTRAGPGAPRGRAMRAPRQH